MDYVTKYGENRDDLNGFEELLRLPFDHQREILCEVIAMMEEEEWRQYHRNDLIKHVIKTNIKQYYPEAQE
jgi:hypothetical protein